MAKVLMYCEVLYKSMFIAAWYVFEFTFILYFICTKHSTNSPIDLGLNPEKIRTKTNLIS